MKNASGSVFGRFGAAPGRRRFVGRGVALALVGLFAGCSATASSPPLTSTIAPSSISPSTTSATTTSATTTSTEPPPILLGPTATPLTRREPGAWTTSTGVVGAIRDRDGDRALIVTPCGGEAWVSTGRVIDAVHVVIDPGHGGGETGAVGPTGYEEKDLNLAVAEIVVAELARVGIRAQLTRTADYRITLQSRAAIATALDAQAFVSIHHNAAAGGPWPRPGSETYYQIADDGSYRLAGLLFEEILDALDDFEADWTADSDAGAKYRPNSSGGDYYGILRNAEGVPAVLTEAAYLDNPSEEALLRRPDVQRAEARGIAQAIARFLTTDDLGTGYVEPIPRTSPAGPGGGADNCVDPALE